MKAMLMARKHSLAFFAVLIGMIAAGSIPSLAVPPGQVYRNYNTQEFTGVCCSSWGDTVTVTEPLALQPVVVTWTAEYFTVWDDFYVGLSVNGGPCLAFGSRLIPRTLPGVLVRESGTFQWVVFPSDGLVKGKNTFTVCGGAVSFAPAGIELGIRTLSVRFSK